MADLPTLKFGCGKLLADGLVHDKETNVYCGEGDKIKAYCEFCQHNFDAVKANAAAYHAWTDEHEKNFPQRKHSLRCLQYSEKSGARDAVLELAGLKPEDLKGKENE